MPVLWKNRNKPENQSVEVAAGAVEPGPSDVGRYSTNREIAVVGETSRSSNATADGLRVSNRGTENWEKKEMNSIDRSAHLRPDVSHSSGAPTVIRAGLHLEGNIKTADDILLEGSIVGEVSANSITISAGATLSGNVSAATIIVDGVVEGVIRCIKLQVNTSGAVSGELHHSVMVVEAGAVIQGTVFRTEQRRQSPPVVVASVTGIADVGSVANQGKEGVEVVGG